MTQMIPSEALDTHIGVLGRTGTGKSYTARGMVERLLDSQRQVVIVDPTGAWWGLRSEFAIPIFGGAHCDVEITDQSGHAVAETILAHRTSAIIDLSDLARQLTTNPKADVAKIDRAALDWINGTRMVNGVLPSRREMARAERVYRAAMTKETGDE